jgi:hypothetical protein
VVVGEGAYITLRPTNEGIEENGGRMYTTNNAFIIGERTI